MRSWRAGIAAAIAGLLWLRPISAYSQDAAAAPDPATPAVSIVAAIEGSTIDETVLVGPSGQLYRPGGDNRWQRTASGGVAVDVQTALGPDAEQMFVVGARSPLYRLKDGAWSAHRLPRRGSVRAAGDGGVPVVVIGRHVHLWQSDKWTSVAQARGTVRAVWASSATRVYVSLKNGALDRWSKGSWTRVATPAGSSLGDGRFAGRPGAKLFLMADTGAVLDVGARRATLVTQAAELQGFTAHVGAVDRSGGLWIAGALPERIVVGHRDGRGKRQPLTLFEVVPGLELGALITALVRDDAGAMLLATQAGQVFIRTPAGSWSQARIASALPSKQFRSQSVRPARTR